MKSLLKKLAIVLTVAGTSLTAHAQLKNVVYGRTSVQFSSNFIQGLGSLGASVADLNGGALPNFVVTMKEVGGVLDLNTSGGEINHTGGFEVNAFGNSVRLQNFTLDLTNPTAPVVTALFIQNGNLVGRLALFNATLPSGFTTPVAAQNGVVQINGMSLTVAAPTANAFNALFGGPVIQAGTPVGTGNVFAILNSDLDPSL